MRGTSRELWDNLFEENFGAAQLVLWPVFNWHELEGSLSITGKHITSLFSRNFEKIQCFTITHFLLEVSRLLVCRNSCQTLPWAGGQGKEITVEELLPSEIVQVAHSHTLWATPTVEMQSSLRKEKKNLFTYRVRLHMTILLSSSDANSSCANFA